MADLSRVDLTEPIAAPISSVQPRVLVQRLLVLGVLGLGVRCFLALISIGSNDMVTWREFALGITSTSVGTLYDEHQYFNHPPLMGFFASAAHVVSEWSQIRFDYLFKAPMILADAVTALLLYRCWRREGEQRAALAFALFCWNPVSILITAYHGNTDSLCAGLALLAAVLMDSRRVALAGLALAAAINVKLIPILLILPIWSCVRTRREALVFGAVLSLGVIPFVPYLVGHWPGFYKHVLAYRSSPMTWGFTFVMYKLSYLHVFIGKAFRSIARFWTTYGFYAVLALPAALAVVQRLRRPWSAVQLAAFTMLGFLAIAPGWGVQYLVYPVALVFAVSLRHALAYVVVNGLLAFAIYALLWTGDVPLFSDFFKAGLPLDALYFAVLAWLLVAYVLYDLLRRSWAAHVAARPLADAS